MELGLSAPVYDLPFSLLSGAPRIKKTGGDPYQYETAHASSAYATGTHNGYSTSKSYFSKVEFDKLL